MFLHWIIDPTLHPGPWRWGDYRDEREWKMRDERQREIWRWRAGVRKVCVRGGMNKQHWERSMFENGQEINAGIKVTEEETEKRNEP